MLRDLLDALRCPHNHVESWLVAMVHRADGPRLLDADLACAVCGAEFVVREGVAVFADAHAVANSDEAVDPLRIAAQLGVTEGFLPLLLAGHYARAGAAVAALVPIPQVWINATPTPQDARAPVSRLQVGDRLPLGVATLAAAAVDAAHATPGLLHGLARAVRPGGRLVAPVHTPLPAGVRELARDDREWVAEVTVHASGLVELRRRAPDQVG
jgi:uncharacterized protein YbaR (Trm112 family)